MLKHGEVSSFAEGNGAFCPLLQLLAETPDDIDEWGKKQEVKHEHMNWTFLLRSVRVFIRNDAFLTMNTGFFPAVGQSDFLVSDFFKSPWSWRFCLVFSSITTLYASLLLLASSFCIFLLSSTLDFSF